jgi:hypothetical protein
VERAGKREVRIATRGRKGVWPVWEAVAESWGREMGEISFASSRISTELQLGNVRT